MTAFSFRAVTLDNRTESGVIQAANAKDATRLLIERGLYPIEMTSSGAGLLAALTRPIGGKLSTTELTQLLKDLGHLLSAGVEMAVALSLMAGSAQDARSRDALDRLIRDVRLGRPLSQALAAQKNGIPGHVVAVVRAGEASGALPRGLTRLADNLRRAATVNAKVRTALIYPACITIAMTIAIIVLLGVVVPALESILPDGTGRLPWQTRLLIRAGTVVRDYWFIGVGVLVALGLTVPWVLRSERCRVPVELFALRLPILGPLLSATETARTLPTLAMLTSAGLPAVAALDIARPGAMLDITQNGLISAGSKLRQGAKLHEALADLPALTSRSLAMVRIGETTGRLGTLLEEAGRDAEERVTVATERLLALLTPVMTLFFGVIAGFVLYAVMTAIMSVNTLAIGPR